MHLNILSLPYHFNEFSELLNDLKIKWKIISITESRLRSEKSPPSDINLPNYEIEHEPNKPNKGGALVYIFNELNYKAKNNLDIHKNKELESIFNEVISKSQENVVVGCMYKHPILVITEFKECYLQSLLDKLSPENKYIILMGHFNMDLLHYETHNQSRDFLDKMLSASLKPHITTHTQITPQSKTLIENNFTYFLDEDIVCGNLTCSTSISIKQFKNLDKRKVKEELENIDWNQRLTCLLEWS